MGQTGVGVVDGGVVWVVVRDVVVGQSASSVPSSQSSLPSQTYEIVDDI